MPAASRALTYETYPRSSSFYAMANCEASFQLSQASGEEPSTTFSDRGTDVHGVISGKIPLELAEAQLKEEAKFLTELRDQRVAEWLDQSPYKGTVVREKRIWMRKGMKPFYSGQPD